MGPAVSLTHQGCSCHPPEAPSSPRLTEPMCLFQKKISPTNSQPNGLCHTPLTLTQPGLEMVALVWLLALSHKFLGSQPDLCPGA